jgi:Protein of unknown function (DUF3800)
VNALLQHIWGISPAQDRVWAQVAGLAASRASRRLFMALNFQAFIDESVGPAGEFVLAGHIATAETWAQFSKAWEAILSYGTRAKNGALHFKMSEMAQNDARMKRVPLFSEVIDEYIQDSISLRMSIADFESAQRRFQSFAATLRLSVDFKAFANPYYFTFWALLGAFHRQRGKFVSHLPLEEKVDFYFDDKSEKKPILAAWDDYLSTFDDEVRQRFGATPRFENDQDFLPLQAADFWAWWVREWYEEDETEMPDKMRNFNFGSWKGKRRRMITIFITEDQIFDQLQELAAQNYAEGNTRPGFTIT